MSNYRERFLQLCEREAPKVAIRSNSTYVDSYTAYYTYRGCMIAIKETGFYYNIPLNPTLGSVRYRTFDYKSFDINYLLAYEALEASTTPCRGSLIIYLKSLYKGANRPPRPHRLLTCWNNRSYKRNRNIRGLEDLSSPII